jgi:hypothetical protein
MHILYELFLFTICPIRFVGIGLTFSSTVPKHRWTPTVKNMVATHSIVSVLIQYQRKFGRLVSCSDWTRHKINISVYSDIGLTQHQSNLIYDIKKIFSSIMFMSMSMFHAHENKHGHGQWAMDNGHSMDMDTDTDVDEGTEMDIGIERFGY